MKPIARWTRSVLIAISVLWGWACGIGDPITIFPSDRESHGRGKAEDVGEQAPRALRCFFGEDLVDLARKTDSDHVEYLDFGDHPPVTLTPLQQQQILATTRTSSLSEAIGFMDNSSMDVYEIRDPEHNRSFTMYHYDSGDNSQGMIFFAGTDQPAAKIGDGQISRCAVEFTDLSSLPWSYPVTWTVEPQGSGLFGADLIATARMSDLRIAPALTLTPASSLTSLQQQQLLAGTGEASLVQAFARAASGSFSLHQIEDRAHERLFDLYVYERGPSATGRFDGFVFLAADNAKVAYCDVDSYLGLPPASAKFGPTDVVARIEDGGFVSSSVEFCNYDFLPWFHQN